MEDVAKSITIKGQRKWNAINSLNLNVYGQQNNGIDFTAQKRMSSLNRFHPETH